MPAARGRGRTWVFFRSGGSRGGTLPYRDRSTLVGGEGSPPVPRRMYVSRLQAAALSPGGHKKCGLYFSNYLAYLIIRVHAPRVRNIPLKMVKFRTFACIARLRVSYTDTLRQSVG